MKYLIILEYHTRILSIMITDRLAQNTADPSG